jgi:hypothetical protein
MSENHTLPSSPSPPVVFKQVSAVVKQLLLFPDEQLLRVLLATVLANLMDGDPLWLFIVGPPSSAKTELIQALSGLDYVYPLSSLTPHTLVSGYISKDDESLLTKLEDGVILTFKDFTSVLTMHREHRGEILGQLREIYDGHYRKTFGTGKVVEWSGKLGFIAGITSVIDTHYSIFNVLGERFIQVRMKLANEIRLAKKAIRNAGQEAKMRSALTEVVEGFFAGIAVPEVGSIAVPEDTEDALARLAAFTVKARSGVVRHGYTREIEYVPDAEAPPRLAKQLLMLCKGHAGLRAATRVGPPDLRVVLRVALDCITNDRRAVLKRLSGSRKALSTSKIAECLRAPYATVERALEDLKCHGVLSSTVTSNATLWTISDWTHARLKGFLSEVSG